MNSILEFVSKKSYLCRRTGPEILPKVQALFRVQNSKRFFSSIFLICCYSLSPLSMWKTMCVCRTFIWLFFFNFGRDILLYYIHSSEKVTFGSREFFRSLFDFLGGNFGPTGNWIVWMEIDFCSELFLWCCVVLLVGLRAICSSIVRYGP